MIKDEITRIAPTDRSMPAVRMISVCAHAEKPWGDDREGDDRDQQDQSRDQRRVPAKVTAQDMRQGLVILFKARDGRIGLGQRGFVVGNRLGWCVICAHRCGVSPGHGWPKPRVDPGYEEGRP
jgi:hypothetical protein